MSPASNAHIPTRIRPPLLLPPWLPVHLVHAHLCPLLTLWACLGFPPVMCCSLTIPCFMLTLNTCSKQNPWEEVVVWLGRGLSPFYKGRLRHGES